jgi:FkbM family methyltransferase
MGGWVSLKASHLVRDIREGGLLLTAWFHIAVLLHDVVHRSGLKPKATIGLRVPGVSSPIQARWGTSDISVFHSIFLSGHYRELSKLQNVQSIVDCGANVGYSAIYLMQWFPFARLVAIEPDPANVDLCRSNLSSFGERVSVLEAAVWPRAAEGLVLDRGHDGGAEPWAIRVREADANQKSDVAAVTISDVTQRFGFESIDILKVDIEGSERELFRTQTQDWLGRVHNLAIELHDDASRLLFAEAMAPYSQRHKDVGELTFCFDLRPRSTAETA